MDSTEVPISGIRCCEAETGPVAAELRALRIRASTQPERWVESRTAHGLALRWRADAIHDELAVSCARGVIFEADLRMIVDVLGRHLAMIVVRRRVQHHAIHLTLREAG